MALPRTETAFDPAPQLGAMATNPSTNMIDLNALFNGRLTDEFSWAFPSGWEFGMSDEAASGTTPALHPAN